MPPLPYCHYSVIRFSFSRQYSGFSLKGDDLHIAMFRRLASVRSHISFSCLLFYAALPRTERRTLIALRHIHCHHAAVRHMPPFRSSSATWLQRRREADAAKPSPSPFIRPYLFCFISFIIPSPARSSIRHAFPPTCPPFIFDFACRYQEMSAPFYATTDYRHFSFHGSSRQSSYELPDNHMIA